MVTATSRPALTLRVSVTDRCDLRCRYCVPEQGVALRSREDILSVEEIARVVQAAAHVASPLAVRLTGGEPLVREGIVGLVALIRGSPVCDLALTTNGQLLGLLAAKLKAAGLDRVNVSLDSLKEDRFAALSRGGRLVATLAGIEAALAAGLTPVKLNAVILRGVNEDEIGDLVRFALTRGCTVRFIELMPVGEARGEYREWFLSTDEIRQRLSCEFTLGPRRRIAGGPAVTHEVTCRATGRTGSVGFISPRSHPFCEGCQRLRLTSQGLLRCCLMRTEGVDLKHVLRTGSAPDALEDALREAVRLKPGGCNSLSVNPSLMAEIGG